VTVIRVLIRHDRVVSLYNCVSEENRLAFADEDGR